jgi:hypothetical protein
MLQNYLWAYEHAQGDVSSISYPKQDNIAQSLPQVAKLKNSYLSKVRKADEAEDE